MIAFVAFALAAPSFAAPPAVEPCVPYPPPLLQDVLDWVEECLDGASADGIALPDARGFAEDGGEP